MQPRSMLRPVNLPRTTPGTWWSTPPSSPGTVSMSGLMASAMSTLDSSINATAATVTTDFYRRLWAKDRSPRHYAQTGRLVSLLFSVVMITTACTIHLYRVSETLDDLLRMFLSILGGGLLSLFLVGMVTLRDAGQPCVPLVATAVTVLSVGGWLFLDTPLGKQLLPGLSAYVPDNFWVSAFANLLLFGVAYFVSLRIGSRRGRDLTGPTVWRPGSRP